MPFDPEQPMICYTDGACLGNPGPGGWAWAVTDGGLYASGADPATTNQRMEVQAAFDAVRTLDGRLEIVSDSTYVVNCFRDRWWDGWIKRGWKNSQKQPVANRDLWEPFVELVQTRGDVTFSWVKGHSGDPMNDLVDRLAVAAAQTQTAASGTGIPPELGPADKPRRNPDVPPAPIDAPRPGQRDLRLPAGRLVLVAGHRPDRLGGFDDSSTADAVRLRLVEMLRAMKQVDGELTIVSGLRLGAEQLGAEAGIEAGLPLVSVLPFPEPDAPWPASSRARFATLVAASSVTITLEQRPPATKQLAGAAIGRRDAWFANQVDAAVVVWDREDDAVGRLVRSLEDHLGADQVLLIHP